MSKHKKLVLSFSSKSQRALALQKKEQAPLDPKSSNLKFIKLHRRGKPKEWCSQCVCEGGRVHFAGAHSIYCTLVGECDTQP